MQYIANRRWKNADFPKSDISYTASFDVRESVKVIFRQSNAASDQVYGWIESESDTSISLTSKERGRRR